MDPQTLALREQYLLSAEPSGAVTLSELAEQLDQRAADSPASDEPSADNAAAGDAAAPPPQATAAPDPDAETIAVSVVGRIFAGDLEPWENGQASFLLAELPAEGHGEGHDADNCPFCKRRAANAPTAIVRFVGEDGEVLPHDVRQLFGVEKNSVVTVRGVAARGELNTLVITADGLYRHGP